MADNWHCLLPGGNRSRGLELAAAERGQRGEICLISNLNVPKK